MAAPYIFYEYATEQTELYSTKSTNMSKEMLLGCIIVWVVLIYRRKEDGSLLGRVGISPCVCVCIVQGSLLSLIVCPGSWLAFRKCLCDNPVFPALGSFIIFAYNRLSVSLIAIVCGSCWFHMDSIYIFHTYRVYLMCSSNHFFSNTDS